jgi:ketosteroid isomerase-like protein
MGRGRQSGVEVATPLAHMFRFREGRVYRVVTYLDREQALRALEELRESRSDPGVDE